MSEDKYMHGHGKRYRVVAKSTSGHCCFEASVYDTETPDGSFSERERDPAWPEHYVHSHVCETFDVDDAIRVADALNAAHSGDCGRGR